MYRLIDGQINVHIERRQMNEHILMERWTDILIERQIIGQTGK